MRRGAIIWVRIPNNQFLLMSTVISRVPPVIVPFIMSIAAYGFAKDWLTSSSLPEHPGNPTPKQYQIALQVNSNADLGAVWATLTYLRTPSRKHHPAWLTKSIAALFCLLSLAYITGFLDIWLHHAVSAVNLTVFTKTQQPTTNFSRLLSPEFCSGPRDMMNDTCRSFSQTAWDESVATATGTSDAHEVVLLPNTTIALLLPAASKRGQETHQASTFATHSTCTAISRECKLRYESASLEFLCFGRPALRNSLSLNSLLGPYLQVMNDSGRSFPVDGARSQPVELGILEMFHNTQFTTVWDPYSQTVEILTSRAILLWCELSILNVTYRVQPLRNSSIQLLRHKQASPRDTFVLSSPFYSG